ncbi:uncharacterized protein [Periplaneta americana]|uniref:uncharacterized protein isoform X2 n=1 Tax=Periplaneta americana TaxID=6978 RepID=UPI0037E93ACD
MDVIKMEHEVDPLAIQTSDNTDVEGKKPSSEELQLFNLHSTWIKVECEDHSCDVTSEIKLEETPLPNMKHETEGDSYELDGVKHELKQEVTAEEDQVFTERR